MQVKASTIYTCTSYFLAERSKVLQNAGENDRIARVPIPWQFILSVGVPGQLHIKPNMVHG